MASDRVFELGLVMAGAISAGAYTAGVLDFLFEALDAYDAAKREPGWRGPVHDVRVPVMSGASAGGMTSAICALHAFHDLTHVKTGAPPPPPRENRLYSSWVSDISLDRLLETSDLEGPRQTAGLNRSSAATYSSGSSPKPSTCRKSASATGSDATTADRCAS